MISVIITLYNKTAYIERALRSVLNQTYQDFEIVVVDDGSTDGGGDIVSRLPDPRIRLVRQRNAGAGTARNRGIRESRGEWIAMLDGDDEWRPGFLRAVAELFMKFPQAGICATGYRTVFKRSLSVDTTLSHQQDPRLIVRDYFVKARVASIVCASSQAIPRRVYDEVGTFVEGEPMGEDLDMWGRIALKYPVAYDCRVLSVCHAEAAERSSSRFTKEPTFPPFVRSAQLAIRAGQIDKKILPALQGYLNRVLMDYLARVIGSGDRVELRRTLQDEFFPTRSLHKPPGILRRASLLLPGPLASFVQRALSSRVGYLLRPVRSDEGVIRRASWARLNKVS